MLADNQTSSSQTPDIPEGMPTTEPGLPTTGSTNPVAPQRRKPRWNKKWLFAGVVVLLIIATTGYLLSNKKAKPIPLTKISVQLEWVNNPEFAGMYVAQDKGYYKAAGLSVDLKEFQDSSDINKEVADGTVDYGVSTPLELILARGQGENNKAIAAIYQTSAWSIAFKKSLAIKTPADFQGKILGDSGNNDEAKVTYAVLMAGAGLSPTDATIKTVDFDAVKAFTDNQADTVDIFRNDQTYLLNKANISYSQIFPEQYGFAIYGDVLIASDNKIAQNPVQTGAFVRATMEGWQYAIAHQAETLAILARHDNVLYKDPAYVKYDLSSTIPLVRTTGDQPLGSMQFVPWNRAYEGVQTAGLLKASFGTNDVYTSQFVK